MKTLKQKGLNLIPLIFVLLMFSGCGVMKKIPIALQDWGITSDTEELCCDLQCTDPKYTEDEALKAIMNSITENFDISSDDAKLLLGNLNVNFVEAAKDCGNHIGELAFNLKNTDGLTILSLETFDNYLASDNKSKASKEVKKKLTGILQMFINLGSSASLDVNIVVCPKQDKDDKKCGKPTTIKSDG